MPYSQQDYLMLSGIQHFEFCRRQWALIHIEQQWEENLRTVEGDLMHANAHDGLSSEKRNDLIISRGMPVFSSELGINGVCDIVEFHRDEKMGVPIFGYDGKYTVFPVEYKRGKPKAGYEDKLQLAAQAMCLEEMLCIPIEIGYLYYGEPRRRTEVAIDTELRSRVQAITKEMHQHYARKYTPKVKPNKSCNSCSLKEICLPKLNKNPSAATYIRSKIQEETE